MILAHPSNGVLNVAPCGIVWQQGGGASGIWEVVVRHAVAFNIVGRPLSPGPLPRVRGRGDMLDCMVTCWPSARPSRPLRHLTRAGLVLSQWSQPVFQSRSAGAGGSVQNRFQCPVFAGAEIGEGRGDVDLRRQPVAAILRPGTLPEQ